ncbi:P-loop containing nucleoside triphosphate hydrolase protein [Xylariaceae sp. FL0804]|nr:P-loop containing nucleoside triphosphate hydrolase protein [Xylariaceae sp. FL0804]
MSAPELDHDWADMMEQAASMKKNLFNLEHFLETMQDSAESKAIDAILGFSLARFSDAVDQLAKAIREHEDRASLEDYYRGIIKEVRKYYMKLENYQEERLAAKASTASHGDSIAPELKTAVSVLKEQVAELTKQADKFRGVNLVGAANPDATATAATSEELQAALEAVNDLEAKLEINKRDLAEAKEATEKSYRQVEIYRVKNKSLFEQVCELKGSIRVMCRIRPASSDTRPDKIVSFERPQDDAENPFWTKMEFQVPAPTSLNPDKTEPKSYEFERIFGMASTNSDVFSAVSDVIESALEGTSVSCFTYGQTGSGKTHTMSSSDGLINRSMELMFKAKTERSATHVYSFELSVIEIYKDDIYDLLQKGRGDNIELRNASFLPVEGSEDSDLMIQQAMDKRKTESTLLNATSSRSHLLIRFRISQETHSGAEAPRQALLTLVDLAGSEKPGDTKAAPIDPRAPGAGRKQDEAERQAKARAAEGTAINMSLLKLNNAITAMGEGRPISYDGSLLKALRPCLAKGSRVLMLVMVSPMVEHLVSTRNTLDKAQEATKARMAAMSAPAPKKAPAAAAAAKTPASSSASASATPATPPARKPSVTPGRSTPAPGSGSTGRSTPAPGRASKLPARK